MNGEDLREATHDRAIQVLRQTPAVVRMVVLRDETQLKEEELYDTFSVELMKKPGKGLGLSIVGKRNGAGVFISDIVSHSSVLQGYRLIESVHIMNRSFSNVGIHTVQYYMGPLTGGPQCRMTLFLQFPCRF